MSNLRTLAYHHAQVARSTAEYVVVPPFDYAAVPLVKPSKTWKWLIPGAAILAIGLVVLLQNSPTNYEVVPGPTDQAAFYTTGLMSDPCLDCDSLALEDGRVLVFNSNQSEYSLTIEVFDPETWGFSPLAELDTLCGCHAIELPDGRVLVFTPVLEPWEIFDDEGHVYSGFSVVGSQAYVLDTATGVLTPMGEPLERWGEVMTSVVLDDGRVLVSGRVTQVRGLAIVDVDEGTFTHIKSINSLRQVESEFVGTIEPQAIPLVPLSDGRVMAVHLTWGGEIFDPADDSITQPAVAFPTSTLVAGLGDGQYLMMIEDTPRAALLDPVSATANAINDAPGPVAELIPLDTGDVLAVPSGDGPWMVFNSDTGRFVTVETEFRPGVDTESATWARTVNGGILFAGPDGSTTIFNPDSREFQAGPPMTPGRNPASMAALPDGRVIAFGMNPTYLWALNEFPDLRDSLDGMSRSADLMAAGGSRRPEGCCAEIPSLMVLRLDQMLSVEEMVAWTTGDLDLIITAPEGSLEGLVGVGYVAAFQPIDPTGQFLISQRYVSGIVDTDLTDCAQGCTVPMAPLSDYDSVGPNVSEDGAGRADRTWEDFDKHLILEVHLLYDGPIPTGADTITLTISD